MSAPPAVPDLRPGLHQGALSTRACGELRYTLSVPQALATGAACPLVVALHYGFDRSAPFPPFYGRGVLENLVAPALGPLQALMVAPDSHGKDWTDAALGAGVMELTDWLLETVPADRDRTLLTGFSLGGIGTWHLLAHAAGRFRAGAAIAAAPPSAAAGAFPTDVPLYVVHSNADEVFPIAKVDRAVETLRGRGGEVHYETISGVTHFDVGGFTPALAAAVPWLRQVWDRCPTG